MEGMYVDDGLKGRDLYSVRKALHESLDKAVYTYKWHMQKKKKTERLIVAWTAAHCRGLVNIFGARSLNAVHFFIQYYVY